MSKDIHVESIDDKEWRECLLGEIVTLQRGFDITQKQQKLGNYPVVSSSGIKSYHDEWKVEGPGVVIGRKGSLGTVFYMAHNFWPHDTTLWVKDFHGNSPSFVYHFLKEFDLGRYDVGSSNPTLNRNHVHLLTASLPPFPEQQAIAQVLSSLDDKIDLLHRQNKTLEAIAETLFRQQFIEIAQKEDLLGNWLSATFGGDWGKESPQGEFLVPVNCIRGTDIADLRSGLAKKTPLRFVKQKKFHNIEPRNGDIIFEISGGTENQSTGRSMYINDSVRLLFSYPLVFSNFCRLLRPKKSEYSYFLFSYLNYLYKHDEFFNLENGSSGIKNLNYKALLFEIEYPMPNEEEILRFNEDVKALFSKTNENKRGSSGTAVQGPYI